VREVEVWGYDSRVVRAASLAEVMHLRDHADLASMAAMNRSTAFSAKVPWTAAIRRWRPAVWCRGSSRLSARVLLPGVHRLPVSAPCSTGRPPCNCQE
jgi:hypothetical protein